MSLNRIKAILLQEYTIMIHSVEVITDLFVFPVFVNVIIFGFLATYLKNIVPGFNSSEILIGMVLWQPIFIVSYSVAVGSLWNIWSQNLTNMFISPISIGEYLFAYGFSGIIKGLLVVTLSYIISLWLFNINILSIPLVSICIFIINLSIFGFSLGIFVLGLIFRFGTRIQALSWSLVGMLQPFMAVIYPVSIIPPQLQWLSWILPPTYIFEAVRKSLEGHLDISSYLLNAFLLNILYFIGSILFFNYMFQKSKEIGQFTKLEI